MLKTILGTLLGAGAGILGTFIRTGLAAAGGILVAKGWLDQGAAADLITALTGAALAVLAAVGSALNNGSKPE